MVELKCGVLWALNRRLKVEIIHRLNIQFSQCACKGLPCTLRASFMRYKAAGILRDMKVDVGGMCNTSSVLSH